MELWLYQLKRLGEDSNDGHGVTIDSNRAAQRGRVAAEAGAEIRVTHHRHVGGTGLVIGRVDQESLRLMRESVTTIDTRGPDDPAGLQLSNFCVHEDRETRNLVVRVTRWDGRPSGKGKVNGSVYVFEVEVSED